MGAAFFMVSGFAKISSFLLVYSDVFSCPGIDIWFIYLLSISRLRRFSFLKAVSAL